MLDAPDLREQIEIRGATEQDPELRQPTQREERTEIGQSDAAQEQRFQRSQRADGFDVGLLRNKAQFTKRLESPNGLEGDTLLCRRTEA